MNKRYATVCVFLFLIFIALYGISMVLQAYQIEESKNNELPQQPTEDNEPDSWNDWTDPMDDPFHNHGKDVGDETKRMNP